MAPQKQIDISSKDDYEKLFAFSARKRSYADFERAIMKEINLFVTVKEEYFRAEESRLDLFIRSLPYLKRIFAKPIIRLKDTENILPVEVVRVINNRSISHIASHSEFWADVEGGCLKPRKLMTLDRKEDYSIYENTAFAYLVDLLLTFVRKNLRLANNTLYVHRDMQFNLFDRANHLNYFLAIGKLHINYARSEDEYLCSKENFYDKLVFLENSLKLKLKSPVYKHCNGKMKKLELKKTNIFRLHKDYKQVYHLLKTFFESDKESYRYACETVRPEAYLTYCAMISVFALGHFNFDFAKSATIGFRRIDAEATFDKWQVRLQGGECDGVFALVFTVTADTKYRICLMTHPSDSPASLLKKLKEKISADEYIVADPVEQGGGAVYLTLYDIESFRRVQQMVMRAMIYSDSSHTTCPFCGKKLSKAAPDKWLCSSCGQLIRLMRCSESGEEYYATSLSRQRDGRADRDRVTSVRKFETLSLESSLHYRNILSLSPSGVQICPRCGKSHG